jgi:hypothetical protein
VNKQKQRQQQRTKRWRDMTASELAQATKQYDREMIDVPSLPVPLELRARHDRVMRRLRGRPRVGHGSQRVMITVERELLGQADRFARSRGLTRSQMIAAGLRAVMGTQSTAEKEAKRSKKSA